MQSTTSVGAAGNSGSVPPAVPREIFWGELRNDIVALIPPSSFIHPSLPPPPSVNTRPIPSSSSESELALLQGDDAREDQSGSRAKVSRPGGLSGKVSVRLRGGLRPHLLCHFRGHGLRGDEPQHG
jgi:hypothetical protein